MKRSKLNVNSPLKFMSQPAKHFLNYLCLASVATVASFIVPAQAATMSYSGDTTGKPTFSRPEAPGFEGTTDNPPTALSIYGTAVPYSSQPFFVSSTGTYDIAGMQNFDGIQFLYRNSFSPTSPLANLISANDSFPDSSPTSATSSFFGVSLSGGSQYFIVTSGFDNTSFGSFTNTISGPISSTASSNITLGTVPEPSSVLGTLAFGIVGSSFMLKRQLKK